jgi:histidinol dehydrogenase
MPMFLSTFDADFDAKFTALLGMKREEAEDVDQAVAVIIADVRARGGLARIDSAL